MKRVVVDLNAGKTLATVSLNRPDKHNGVDWETIKEIKQVQAQLRKLRSLRAIVLRGNGPSFSSGLDFKSVMGSPATMAAMYAHLWAPFRNIFQSWSMGWRDMGVPVIAEIHGNCFGAGLQLAMGADIRIAKPDSKLSLLEAKWGLVPDMGGGALIRELLPADVAKELMMTGRVMSGTEAKALGLVTHVADNPSEHTQRLLSEILERSPDSVAASKHLIQNIFGLHASSHLTQERRWQRRLMGFKNQRLSVLKHSAKDKVVAFATRQIR